MDMRQHSRGASDTPRYKAQLTVNCPKHPEGHHTRLYSGIDEDAWWLGDLLRRVCESHGYPCALIFYRRLASDLWEIVPESIALDTYPPDGL